MSASHRRSFLQNILEPSNGSIMSMRFSFVETSLLVMIKLTFWIIPESANTDHRICTDAAIEMLIKNIIDTAGG
jgi:hypothetical protein